MTAPSGTPCQSCGTHRDNRGADYEDPAAAIDSHVGRTEAVRSRASARARGSARNKGGEVATGWQQDLLPMPPKGRVERSPSRPLVACGLPLRPHSPLCARNEPALRRIVTWDLNR
ncbi:hypothetical protein OAO87_04635 [bacterium]|nr:hypothetical protein [bacterium]